MINAVLCDIEGTTSAISFVKETLFPYARTRIKDFVESKRDTPEVAHEIRRVIENGDQVLTLDDVIAKLQEWIDQDKKETALKTLQGMIWKEGFQRGDFRGHLYPDVAPALRRWKESGIKIFIYSSGSVQAQKLYFQYSDEGDLTPLFSGHFDTTTGHKREVDSYKTIAREIGLSPETILFLSDIPEELEAAEAAKMKTIRLVRANDARPGSRFTEVENFDQIHPEKL